MKLNNEVPFNQKFEIVLNSTGPYYITELYKRYSERENVTLLPANIFSPLSKNDIAKFSMGEIGVDEIELKLKDAVAIHYFNGSWYSGGSITN